MLVDDDRIPEIISVLNRLRAKCKRVFLSEGLNA